MAKLSQIQQAYANPRVRKYLDFIAEAEGVQHGYNTLFGNQRFNNLGAHPNVRKSFKQTDGATNHTTAAGRYQFLNGTWNNLAKQYGFRDFSPQSQDLGAIALLAQNGALPYILKGDFSTAIQKSGRTWASLPSSTYKQGKRSWDFVNKHLGSNIQQQQPNTQPQRAPIVGNWANLARSQDKRPAVGKWAELTSQATRAPIVGNWSDLIKGNQGG
ncbi:MULTISPECIES: glycoside hydrolase family 104 protein [unclassified Acinetobacter]|uniref:glycoside hydrolase family 24 protein n=1 Tax=unclassified Acinetobacter TaxID=196816 RepID=UPI00211E8FD7|nr:MULTISPECIES: glycoside hydrolase family 104 protein [unclassified Acinetobacter]